MKKYCILLTILTTTVFSQQDTWTVPMEHKEHWPSTLDLVNEHDDLVNQHDVNRALPQNDIVY